MALSDDLRKRVVVAVVEDGLSRDAAAKRFEASVAPATSRLSAGLDPPRAGHRAGALQTAPPFKPAECENFFNACGYDTA